MLLAVILGILKFHGITALPQRLFHVISENNDFQCTCARQAGDCLEPANVFTLTCSEFIQSCICKKSKTTALARQQLYKRTPLEPNCFKRRRIDDALADRVTSEPIESYNDALAELLHETQEKDFKEIPDVLRPDFTGERDLTSVSSDDLRRAEAYYQFVEGPSNHGNNEELMKQIYTEINRRVKASLKKSENWISDIGGFVLNEGIVGVFKQIFPSVKDLDVILCTAETKTNVIEAVKQVEAGKTAGIIYQIEGHYSSLYVDGTSHTVWAFDSVGFYDKLFPKAKSILAPLLEDNSGFDVLFNTVSRQNWCTGCAELSLNDLRVAHETGIKKLNEYTALDAEENGVIMVAPSDFYISMQRMEALEDIENLRKTIVTEIGKEISEIGPDDLSDLIDLESKVVERTRLDPISKFFRTLDIVYELEMEEQESAMKLAMQIFETNSGEPVLEVVQKNFVINGFNRFSYLIRSSIIKYFQINGHLESNPV